MDAGRVAAGRTGRAGRLRHGGRHRARHAVGPAESSRWPRPRTLARQAASLTGAARSDNDQQIDALLAQLDDATLQREAAALPAGDPLYNYAGRALLAPRPAAAAAVRSQRVEIRCRQSSARRKRWLSPAGEARRAAAAVGQSRRRRRAGARRLPRRLLRRNPPSSRSRVLRHRRHRRAARRRLRPRGRRRQRLRRRPARARRSRRVVQPRPRCRCRCSRSIAAARRRRRATPASRCRRKTKASPQPNTCSTAARAACW